MTEILTIYVKINGIINVKGKNGEVSMLLFEGHSESDYFSGTVCPGGVDTQKQETGKIKSLSARYVLEGKDYTGCKCRIFIENNAETADEDIITKPRILTDSDALSFLETAELSGSLTPNDGGVTVHICCSGNDIPVFNTNK